MDTLKKLSLSFFLLFILILKGQQSKIVFSSSPKLFIAHNYIKAVTLNQETWELPKILETSLIERNQTKILSGKSSLARTHYYDSQKEMTESQFAVISNSNDSIEIYIQDFNDNAEERTDGTIVIYNDKDFDSNENTHLGFIFDNVTIPSCAVVDSSKITFTSDYPDSYPQGGANTITIHGINTDNQNKFEYINNYLSFLPKTSDSIIWNLPTFTESDIKYTSPNVGNIVKKIINRPGWDNGNSVGFIISGFSNNKRVVYSRHNAPNGNEAKLTIYYSYINSAEINIKNKDDNAEERLDGTIIIYNDKDFDSNENILLGFTFDDVDIPDCSCIDSSKITFTSDYPDSYPQGGANTITIHGINTDNQNKFEYINNYLSFLPKTSDSIIWSLPTFTESDIKYTSPNVGNIVKKIINRPGWDNGNSVGFIISGFSNNKRVVFSKHNAPEGSEAKLTNYFSYNIPATTYSDSTDLTLKTGTFSSTYYVKNEGDDNLDGLSDATAWATLTKVQQKLEDSTIKADNAVLFKSGDIFYGGLNIDINASLNNEIYIGAYSKGPKPVFSGVEILSYSGLDSLNIYRFNLGKNKRPRIVLVDDVRYDVATLPETGWYKIDSAFLTDDKKYTHIYDDTLSYVSWNKIDSASILCRAEPWGESEVLADTMLNDLLITTKSRFSYSENEPYKVFNDKHILTNYRYASDANYLYIMSSNDLSGAEVKVCGEEFAVEIENTEFLTIDNIYFTMYQKGIYLDENKSAIHKNFTFRNNNFYYIEENAILHSGPAYGKIPNIIIEGNKFNKIGDEAIVLRGVENGSIKNNFVSNTGWFFGSAKEGSGAGIVLGDLQNTEVMNNRLDSIKSIALQGQALNRAFINNNYSFNYITNTCLGFTDIGALYFVNNTDIDNEQVFTNNIVSYNIIKDIPSDEIYSWYWDDHKAGIYTDEKSHNIKITNNTIINSPMGIYAHAAKDISRSKNNIYNCGHAFSFQSKKETDILGNKVDSNIIAMFEEKQFAYELADTFRDNPPEFSHNVIINFGDSLILEEWDAKPPWTKDRLTLDSMQTIYQNYTDTIFSTFEYNPEDCIIKYNPKNTAQSVLLPFGTYKDVFGNSYSGSINLMPGESKVLLKQHNYEELNDGVISNVMYRNYIR